MTTKTKIPDRLKQIAAKLNAAIDENEDLLAIVEHVRWCLDERRNELLDELGELESDLDEIEGAALDEASTDD